MFQLERSAFHSCGIDANSCAESSALRRQGYDVTSPADGAFLEQTFNLTSGASACNLTAGREAHCIAFYPDGFPWNGAWQHIPAVVAGTLETITARSRLRPARLALPG